MSIENEVVESVKTVKVQDLSGPVLDYLAAIAYGLPKEEVFVDRGVHCMVYLPNAQRAENMGILTDALIPGEFRIYKPTEWWSHAGPLIDMEDIGIEQAGNAGAPERRCYAYTPDQQLDGQFSDKTLEAVVRSFVAAKLGKEIPEEWVANLNGEKSSALSSPSTKAE